MGGESNPSASYDLRCFRSRYVKIFEIQAEIFL